MAGGTIDSKVTRKGLSLKDKVIYSVLSLVALGSVAFVWIDNHRAKKEKDNLYQKVSLIANTNDDNITDHQEWAKVYESLGLTYDIHYSDPKEDLSNEKMQKYLNK